MDKNGKKKQSYRTHKNVHSKSRQHKEQDYFGLGNNAPNKGDGYRGEYEFENINNPFFTDSKLKLNVKTRTNNAEDYFENKDYTPWDENDDFNRRTRRARVSSSKKVKPKNISRSKWDRFKKGLGSACKNFFTSGVYEGDDYERDGLADNIKNTRKNKKLLDELNSKKKPLSKRQRKMKNILISGVTIVGVLTIGIILSLTVLFKCEKIEVSGSSRYKESDIVSASRLSYGENIFMADKDSASKNIEAKYPYIEDAEISVGIPNKIIINIKEAAPEYYIQSGSRYYIISKDSKILEEVIRRELDIPTISGCKLKNPKPGQTLNVENEKILTVLNDIANSMESNGVTGIKEIDLSDMANIQLNYQNRITIVIGMPEYIDYKMRTAMTIITTKLSDADKGRLDCSNLVEGRTDGKSNKSYFSPNNVIGEDPTEAPTEAASEAPTEALTQAAIQTPVQQETEPLNDDAYTPQDTANTDYSSDTAQDDFAQSSVDPASNTAGE